MDTGTFEIYENKVIIKMRNRICETADELIDSALFREIIRRGLAQLTQRKSRLMNVFGGQEIQDQTLDRFILTLKFLVKMPAELVPNVVPESKGFLKDRHLFSDLVEFFYNYWRSYERMIICDSEGRDYEKHPYRTFRATIEELTGLVRSVYRDIQENTTKIQPRIFRQVTAGAEIATVTMPKRIPFPDPAYNKLNGVPIIRHILLKPPLILDQSSNKRTGKFERINQNPLSLFDIHPADWLCFPAKVGPLVILIYFHKKFYEMGLSLCNLFEIASDQDLERMPDAVYAYGAPVGSLQSLGCFPTVFFDDEKNKILSAACPQDNQFGYFGYLKKMVLTLHNIRMMKQGKLPFHGAMVRLIMKGGRDATILFIGDTGAGKSETLEALREMGDEHIQDLIIIADDMGSLEVHDQGIIGYGTETGAFLRLDDLQPGYALGQIDRAIIMSPNKVNARIILPVTTFENLIKGHKVDYILYANNYEDIDEEHPILEQFPTAEVAIKVFREGTVMSKGTTTTSGIVHSYFANIFGPPQYKDVHDVLAQKYFQSFFDHGIFVGQVRTRLGIPGWERKGPEEAARELFKILTA